MSDPKLDALADSARYRGLKLVRSRVRTKGKAGYGKVGLTDAGGKPVFGIDDSTPSAEPDEVADYLRNMGARDWGASLDVAVMPHKKKPAKAARAAANDPEPVPKPPPAPKPPKPRPEPKLKLRDARPSDAAALTKLIRFLGHEIEEKAVRKNLGQLAKLDEVPLVATLDKRVVGLCGVHRTVTIHRDAPLGRITILVVADDAQDTGLGRKLVEAAEDRLRKSGCKMVEVTSNDRRGAAHAFYRHLGFERTSIRFCKTL